jgi:pimeloyl-ACP methyl ester carboxylesterase
MAESRAALDNEFAALAGPVGRCWVNVPAGGQVSGVIWGTGPPEVVFLHEAGRSARAWDEVALALGRPAVAIDLPGHGRSDWRRDGRYEPRKLAGAIAEAIRSFAPRAALVVGSGLGGRTAIALTTTPRPAFLRRLALIDTLPGTAARGQEAVAAAEHFGSRDEAAAALAARHPDWPQAATNREASRELVQDPGGGWVWRHHIGNMTTVLDPPLDDVTRPLDDVTRPLDDVTRPLDDVTRPLDDVTLWEELAGLENPAFVIHGERSGCLTGTDLLDLGRRAPRVKVITIPGVADVVARQPAVLASELNRLAGVQPGEGRDR